MPAPAEPGAVAPATSGEPRASSVSGPTPDRAIEILVVGRVSIDLYADEAGPFDAVTRFRKAVGGTATNVAIAAARLDHASALVTKVGAEGFGDYVRSTLVDFGVDTRWVGTDEELQTPLALAVLDPPDDPTLVFYRAPAAPDERLRDDDIPWELAESAPLVWIPASRFAREPSATTVSRLLARRGRRRHTVIDLDYRPMFWPSREVAGDTIRPTIDHATVVVGNREEVDVVVGTDDPERAADRLLDRGVELAVVKLGGDGVYVATSHERHHVEPVPIDVVCGLGAGDAFGGMLCHGLLAGWDAATTARYANAAGALVASRLLCSEAMPTMAEVEEMLATVPDPKPKDRT